MTSDLIKAGATQTETSLLKQYAAGERVNLLDDYDLPARTITETLMKFGIAGNQKSAFFNDIESFIPKSTRKSKKNHLSWPWFSKKLRCLTRRKNQLFKRAVTSGNPDHWRTYCSARNKTTTAINRAKRAHFKSKETSSLTETVLHQNGGVSRGSYAAWKGVLPSVFHRCYTDSAGDIVSETKAKANLLNDVFVRQNTSLIPDAVVFGPLPLTQTFNLGKISPSEVRRVLKSLPNKLSCRQDQISYQMMKEAGPRVVGPLVSLFAVSIRLRQVPDEWRKAIVTPIFKGGRKDRRDPTSYRPIALTSWVARVMEKILNGRIFDCLDKTHLSMNINQDFNEIIQQVHSSAF